MAYFEQVQALMPNATPLLTEGSANAKALASTVEQFENFLNEKPS